MLIFPSSPVDQQTYTTGTIVYQYNTATTSWGKVSTSITVSTQYVSSSTASTGTNSGAFVVTGGAGIGGNLNVGGAVTATQITQTSAKIRIGPSAGLTQGTDAIAIGNGAGYSQGTSSISIGNGAGGNSQGSLSIAIGNSAGATQGNGSIAIGDNTGQQGTFNTFIGSNVASGSTAPNGTTIIGANVGSNQTLNIGTYIGPIRADASTSATAYGIYYNPVTQELTTSTAAAGGGGAAITIANDTSTTATYFVQLSSISAGTLTTSTVSSTKLYYVPSTGTLNATIFNSLSDITQKSNISVISNGLEIVEGLRGVTFDWADGSGSSAGLLAQEVEQWLPQLVSTGPNGVKNLNYSGVIGALVEAVKTLSDRVKILESR